MSSVMTRSQTAKKALLASKEEELKRMLESINCSFSGHGKGLVMVSFNHKVNGKEIKEIVYFKLIDGDFKVIYCNFFPYGYPKHFKQIHGKNTELFNTIEAYLRIKGENFVSYSLEEYDRMRAQQNKKQVSNLMKGC